MDRKEEVLSSERNEGHNVKILHEEQELFAGNPSARTGKGKS